MNPLVQMMMTQLKGINPNAYKTFEQFRNSGNDPRVFINQLTSNYTPAQKQNFLKFANNFGISNEQLENLGINTKV